MSSERTLVGIPFYEKEGQECLEITLKNIDECLARAALDATVIVRVNGPETARGNRPQLDIPRSTYGANIEIVASDKVGQVTAMDDMVRMARDRNVKRMFITDADIFRFPDSMSHMWNCDNAVIVGAQYRPYPIEIVEAHFGALTPQERLLYQVFDGDQHPSVRAVMRRYEVDRKKRVKGSLMLVDTEKVQHMHDNQTHVSDSVINRVISDTDKVIADDAFFMHMGRVDMTDHIKARLRHFVAAEARGKLDTFLHREVRIPRQSIMNAIATDIREEVADGDYIAMLYLSRCAVREKVNQICLGIARRTWNISQLGEIDPISMHSIQTYQDAERAISRFFVDVDWDNVLGATDGPPPITQEVLRQPFDVGAYMRNDSLAAVALASFGRKYIPSHHSPTI